MSTTNTFIHIIANAYTSQVITLTQVFVCLLLFVPSSPCLSSCVHCTSGKFVVGKFFFIFPFNVYFSLVIIYSIDPPRFFLCFILFCVCTRTALCWFLVRSTFVIWKRSLIFVFNFEEMKLCSSKEQRHRPNANISKNGTLMKQKTILSL